MATALALGSACAYAGDLANVKWVGEMSVDLVGGDTIRTVTLNNGNTVNAHANEGIVLNVGGVIANSKNSPFETQFTLGYKFNIVTSGEPVWYSIPLEVIEYYNADTLRTGLGLSYHMDSKLKIAGKTTDRFDNALGLVAIVGLIDRNASHGKLYSIDLRYTFIKYQPSNMTNASKIDGGSLGISISLRN